MEKERGFMPIDEASSDKVQFAVDLPHYLDRTKIQANPERIISFMELGGINNIKVQTYEGEKNAPIPSVVGFDSQGSAYSGGLASSEKTKDFELSPVKKGGSPKSDLVVSIDIQKASSDIAREDVRSYKKWGNRFNNDVLKGIRSTGNKVLLWENAKYDSKRLFFYGSLMSCFWTFTGFNVGEIVGSYLVYSPINSLLRLHEDPFDDNRLSLFAGPQLDRAVLLQVKTRLQKVVKGFEEEK